ncbi:MAG TPA: ATP-binding protein [Kofleriaceae bacterium]|jgi:signal transduction histidine kinase|nr:ATP-binding protein [Kofleriaceae bacterium]
MAAPRYLRSKLIVGALAPLVIAATVQALYSVVSQRHEALAGLEAKAHALTSLLVNVAGPSIAVDDPAGVDEGLAYLEHDPDFGFALAVAPDGKVLGFRGPREAREAYRAAAAPTREPVMVRTDDMLIASYPVITRGKPLGQLVVGLRTASAAAKAARLTAWAAAISLVGIAAAVVVVLVLAGRIARRNREMTDLLDNMDQGFLSMHRDGTLAAERSALATRLLGGYQPGQRLWQAIEPHDADTAAWLELCWDSVLANDLPLELTLHQLPGKLAIGERSYRIEYKPRIVHGAVGDTLVVLTDTTAERARERAEAAERDLLRMVEQMTHDRTGFTEFVEETDRLIHEIDGTPRDAVSDQLKREVHTLKGNCAIYGVSQLSEACHVLEDGIAAHGALDRGIVHAMVQAWTELKAKLDRMFGGHARAGVDVGADDLAELREAIARGASLGMIERIVRRWALERTRPRLERFAEQIRGLADRLGKGGVEVELDDHGVRLEPARFRPFWTALSHVVRNAVDHGLEPPVERAAAGKPEHGQIALITQCDANQVTIEVRDDGRGVDWDALRTRARDAGRPHATRADLVDAMFSDGVSTRDDVTEISGRGVGLAAIHDAARRLGGKIDVDSERGHGTRFRFTFDLDRQERITRITRELPRELPAP